MRLHDGLINPPKDGGTTFFWHVGYHSYYTFQLKSAAVKTLLLSILCISLLDTSLLGLERHGTWTVRRALQCSTRNVTENVHMREWINCRANFTGQAVVDTANRWPQNYSPLCTWHDSPPFVRSYTPQNYEKYQIIQATEIKIIHSIK